jgi:membrane protein required for colicin V production
MIFKGKREGFISQLLSLTGIILGIVLSISFGEDLGSALGINQQWAAIIGFIIILILTTLATSLLTRFLAKSISFAGLDWLNTVLGIVFSILKGLVILGMFYAAIFAINERARLVEPEEFDKSSSFNVVRKVANPLLEYWDRTKPIEKLTQASE